MTTPTTTTTTPVTPGVTIVAVEGNRWARVLSPAQALANGLLCEAGTVAVNSGSTDRPFFSFAVLTGRTRRKWGIDCPTIVRFECDTVVRENAAGVDGPAIWGVPGARIPGVWLTRPENVAVTR